MTQLQDDLKDKPTPVRRREIGITGAIIVLSQVLSNFQSSQTVSNDISKFKEDFLHSKVEQERDFARKTDLAPILPKLDKMSDQISKLGEQVSALKAVVRDRFGYTEAKGPTIFGKKL